MPHLGCPKNCSFCNQKRISGQKDAPHEKDLQEAVEIAYSYNKDLSNTELAFFGGSFTAIEKDYMLRLLTKGKELVEKFGLFGIRISTRPDYIDQKILDLLKQYKVTAIELGAQSMDDQVLQMNNRGHNSQQIIDASNLIKQNGFELGLQMMTGLYGSNANKDYETAIRIVNLKPKTLRVYPTIVFAETELCDLFEKGEYTPDTIEKTVDICVKIIKLCQIENVKIIRLGLHSTDEVNHAVAGPIHPAIMELCQSKIFYEELLKLLPQNGEYKVFVNPKKVSIAIGQKKENIKNLEKLGYFVQVLSKDDLDIKEIQVQLIK